MKTETTGIIFRKFKLKKKTKKLIAIGLVVVLVAGAATTYFVTRASNASAMGLQQLIATVQKGDISKAVEASGPIESATRKTVAPKVTSTIETINYSEGDEVKKGDVMFTLDDTDALLGIEEVTNNIATTELSLNDTMESIAALNVTAPFNGQVTDINLSEGDDVNGGGTILTITDTSRLQLTVPFSGNGITTIREGHSATVYLPGLMSSVEGSVTYISTTPYMSSNGNQLYTVEITVNNPGSLLSNTSANAEISTAYGTLSSVETGTLEYLKSKVLRSDSGGTVLSINVKEKQYVNKGDLLVTLENDSLESSLNTIQLKLKSLQSQLDIKNEQLSYYTLTAPCNGTIIAQEVSPGDTVSQGSNIAVVADMNDLQFEVSIDELDIGLLEVGQTVSITADAVEETSTKPLSGKVKKISAEGTSSNGVTVYPVVISVDSTELLKTGMNVNGTIQISSSEDVLLVPIEAVTTMKGRSYVYVKTDTTGIGGNAANAANTGNGAAPGATATDGTATDGTATDGTATDGTATDGTATQSGNSKGGNAQGGRTRPSGTSAGGPPSGSMPSGEMPAGFSRGTGTAGGTATVSSGSVSISGQDYYAGTVLTEVTTGDNDDTNIEITDGLTEGQIVVLPQTTTNSEVSSDEETQRQQSGGFGGASMIGGASGGMPSGGGGPPAGF